MLTDVTDRYYPLRIPPLLIRPEVVRAIRDAAKAVISLLLLHVLVPHQGTMSLRIIFRGIRCEIRIKNLLTFILVDISYKLTAHLSFSFSLSSLVRINQL